MRRDLLDLGFTLMLLALISWTTFEASKWDARARLFPWAAGIPVLLLLLVQVTRQVRVVLMTHGGERVMDETADSHETIQRTLHIVGWILGFALLIWAVGFGVGGTLGTLLYLKASAHEKWPVSLAITVGTGAFFWILSTYLYVPFPRGFIVDLLVT